jgi:hypothetical protein
VWASCCPRHKDCHPSSHPMLLLSPQHPHRLGPCTMPEFDSWIILAVLSCHCSIIFISRKPAYSMLIVGILWYASKTGQHKIYQSTPVCFNNHTSWTVWKHKIRNPNSGVEPNLSELNCRAQNISISKYNSLFSTTYYHIYKANSMCSTNRGKITSSPPNSKFLIRKDA